MFLRLLFRFFFFLFLIFLIRAAIRYFSPGGPKTQAPPPSPSNQSSKVISGQMEKDPVCGMYIDKTSSLHSEKKGQTFYFCSDDCQKKFQATNS